MARAGHTATLLASGQVLVVGNGIDAEVYDPANDRWTATKPMVSDTGLGGHAATLLVSGKVLVTGGNTVTAPSVTASAQVYDPSTNAWSPVAPMLEPRERHTATLLSTGEVLVTGGASVSSSTGALDFVASAERYDPTTDEWKPAASMHEARVAHRATSLWDGRVLIVGGADQTGMTALASAELYDPSTDRWTSAGNSGATRIGHTVTLLPSGEALVVGGWADTDGYDATTNTWKRRSPTHVHRNQHTATLLPNGEVLVVGGQTGTSTGYAGLASAELFHGAP